MARLKFKQIYSNLQYDTASSVLTLSGSQETDFVISGSVTSNFVVPITTLKTYSPTRFANSLASILG